jgi:hypothetical protein
VRRSGGRGGTIGNLGQGTARVKAGTKTPRSVDAQPTVRKSSSGPVGVHIPTSNGEILITRRQLLYGALGIAGIAGAAAGASALSEASKSSSAISTLSVSSSQVFTLDDCTELAAADTFKLVGDYDLPIGTLLWANNESVAACLLPTAQASPLTQVAILHLGTGRYETVLEKAIGSADGFEIYDVRASEKGLIWTESAILEGTWRIYAAPFDSSFVLGTARMLEEGGDGWETPTIAAVGASAFWQTMPTATSSEAKTATARLKRAAFASGSGDVLWEAKGRMACPVYACEDAVVIAPHCAQSSSYYELVRISESTGQQTDAVVLPSGMAPNAVGYGPNGFSFCFDSIYSYGDGIANLGTYTPASAHNSGSGYSGIPWFRFARTPKANPCWCTNDWFMVKSTQSVCAINLANKTYVAFGVESGCTDWGDYLASTGMNGTVVTVMRIDTTDTSETTTQKTQVRIWQPIA